MSAAARIYGEASLLTLISRGWNLYRHNVRMALLLMLLPIFFFTLHGLLSGFISSIPSLINSQSITLQLGLLAYVFSLCFSFLSWLTLILTSTVLSRVYYAQIIHAPPVSLQDGLAYLKKVGLFLAGLMILLLIITVLLSLLMIGLSFAGLFGVGLVVGILRAMATQSNPLYIAAGVVFLIVMGFVVLALVLFLLGFTFLFFIFPFLGVATSDGEKKVDAVFYAWKQLFGNFPRLVLYVILLITFASILSTTLNLPLGIWTAMEMKRIALSEGMTDPSIPLHVSFVVSIWGNLVNMVMFPFMVGAMTVCWYDCQVRREGIDIQLWLKQIQNKYFKRSKQQQEVKGS